MVSIRTSVGQNPLRIWQDMARIAAALDFSDYGENHPLFTQNPHMLTELKSLQLANKKRIGKYKDEAMSGLNKSAFLLKPKLYSIVTYPDITNILTDGPLYSAQKVKGITRSVVARQITHELFGQVISDEMPRRFRMFIIRSHLHTLFIEMTTKVGLSLFDDKRYWVSKWHSLPYGFQQQPNNAD